MIATGTSSGGGDVERMRFNGGDGTRDIEVTNANFIVSGNLTAGTIDASKISNATVGDSTGGVKAVYFDNTENDGTPHYTDKSGILAFDENFYPDTDYGTGTYDPASTFVGNNGGGLLIKNEDGWGAIFTSQNTRWAKGYWNSLDVSGGVTASSFTTSGLAASSFLSATPGFQSEFIYTKGLVNQGETGTGPAAIIFGNGSTTGNDQISLITGGDTRLYIDNSGNVGINQNSPTAKLHIKPNHTSYSNPSEPVGAAGVAVYNETNSDPTITHSIISLRTGGPSGGDPFISYDIAAEHGWTVGIDNSAGTELRFSQSWANFGSTRAYISVNSTANEIDFTGQHRSFIDTIAHTDYLKYEGLIVSANKNQYFDIQEEIVTGVQAIKINESLPLVSISNVAYDKCCFGVISGSEDTNDREYSQGSFVSVLKKQDGDIRAHVNSVGEGAIWVVNTNGILESGDYITTSNVAGYGQKQDSEFLANYTVAKITMDCDFNPSTQPTRIIKRELRDVNYWVKYTYDDISEEEYTRVKNLGRRVRIIESGTEISQEEYENHTKKEGYTETESNTYIRNETTHQRVFSDKKTEPTDGFNLEVRQELVNVLDEHGQLQWEDDPSGATEKAYKIRYLDVDGNIVDEANAVHIAAFVGCTYHCG